MVLATLLWTALLFTVSCCIEPQRYMVKMRDGIELNTVAILNSTSPLPVVLIRTPYGTASAASTQDYYVKLGYNTVSQDFRGRYGSQGSFDFWNHSSPDAYDTMAWIVAQNWSNKEIFTQGVSANGIACYLQAQDQPPWLKGQYVVFGNGEVYKSVYQGGAYRYGLIHDWLTYIDEGHYETYILQNEAYNTFWEDTNDDLFWSNIKWPAVHQTGWYDIFLQQQLDAYAAYSTQSQSPYNLYNFLIVGPGGHCAQGGQVPWPLGTLDSVLGVYISDILFAVLQGVEEKALQAGFSNIYYYVLGPALTDGEVGNYWTNATAFPTPKYVNIYLNAGGYLTTQAPTVASANATYIYNPSKPVPTYGGNNLFGQCGPWDQRELEVRSDVITFTTTPFAEAFCITGHVYAYLYVSSNATDTDFTVKYTDVYPNGTSMLIQDGILRMKWRENSTVPSPMVPGEVYSITVDLWSTSYIFNAGHALRISVSSSNSPRFDANLNNGNPLSDPGKPLLAANTIYFDATYPSYVEFPVVPIPPPTVF